MWQNFNPVKILHGKNILCRIDSLIPEGLTLIITSQGFIEKGLISEVVKYIKKTVIIYDSVTPNPDISMIKKVIAEFSEKDINSVIAIGGGSVIDTAKVLALSLAENNASILNTGFDKDIIDQLDAAAFLIAVPTTAGTGSEVTPFATVWDREYGKKRSVANKMLYPEIALLDPVLHLTLPGKETLYSALDCISHSLESIWNKNRNPISLALAGSALSCSISTLPLVIRNPNNIDFRDRMLVASTMAGIAISQNQTALAHAISYPLTVHFSVPHGLAAGFTLKSIIRLLEKNNMVVNNGELKGKIDEIEKVLCSLNLNDEISGYLTKKEAMGKVPEMLAYERLDNFIYKVDPEEFIVSVLNDSF